MRQLGTKNLECLSHIMSSVKVRTDRTNWHIKHPQIIRVIKENHKLPFSLLPINPHPYIKPTAIHTPITRAPIPTTNHQS